MIENKNNLRTTEGQIVQTFNNNKPRPKFTGSFFKKACIYPFVYKSALLVMKTLHIDGVSVHILIRKKNKAHIFHSWKYPLKVAFGLILGNRKIQLVSQYNDLKIDHCTLPFAILVGDQLRQKL